MARFMLTTLIFVALAIPKSWATGVAPYTIDPEVILEMAIGAVVENHPEISPSDLGSPTPVFISCFLARPNDELFALDEVFQPCWGSIQFELGPTNMESRYKDGTGNCVVSADPEYVQVEFHADGSLSTRFGKGMRENEQVVECTDNFKLTTGEIELPPMGVEPFRIDAKEIVRIAYLAALAEHPDIAPEQLGVDTWIRLSCSANRSAETESILDTTFKPCNARLTFAVKSIGVDLRYVNEKGLCMEGRAYDGLKVFVNADGSTRVGQRDETPGTVRNVECTEDFYSALLQTSG